MWSSVSRNKIEATDSAFNKHTESVINHNALCEEYWNQGNILN